MTRMPERLESAMLRAFALAFCAAPIREGEAREKAEREAEAAVVKAGRP